MIWSVNPKQGTCKRPGGGTKKEGDQTWTMLVAGAAAPPQRSTSAPPPPFPKGENEEAAASTSSTTPKSSAGTKYLSPVGVQRCSKRIDGRGGSTHLRHPPPLTRPALALGLTRVNCVCIRHDALTPGHPLCLSLSVSHSKTLFGQILFLPSLSLTLPAR